MRRFLWAAICVSALAAPAAAQDIRGSGSTFIYAVMAKWVAAYAKAGHPQIIYQPIGSAAGITEIRHGLVDFAVTEAPLDDAQLLRDGFAQFPLVVGAIVPVINVDGIAPGQLRLTGALLADIYLGKISNWNDPAIVAINPELAKSRLAILPLHRSDGSGSSYVWADYLSKISPEWKARVGASTLLAWPTGVGVKQNRGMVDALARIRGAIGYVDQAAVLHEKLAYALLRNQAGQFVAPDPASFQAAITGVDWAQQRDFFLSLTDPPMANAYPIMAVSFALVARYPKDPARARDLQSFFRWSLESGRDLAGAQDYLALSPQVVQLVEGYWEAEAR